MTTPAEFPEGRLVSPSALEAGGGKCSRGRVLGTLMEGRLQPAVLGAGLSVASGNTGA